MSKIDHRAAITNVRYDKTRTKKGNVSRAAVRKAVYYAMFGHPEHNPDQLPRGEWGIGPIRAKILYEVNITH